MRNQFAGAIAVVMLASQAPGQSSDPSITPRVKLGSRTNPTLDIKRFQELTRRLEQQATRYSWDPRAEPLLKSADEATLALFHVELKGIRKRSVFKRGEDGDVMTVLWDISADGVKGSLLLEDTLIQSKYVLELNNATIERLAELIPGMLVYPRPLSGSLTIERIEDRQPIIAQFEIHSLGGSYAWVREYHVRGMGAADGGWTIEVVVGKASLTQFYGQTVWVPERVPPLGEVVRSWSDHRLVSELSVNFIANDRDRIILAELVRRTPTDVYLLDLLAGAGGNQMTQLNRFGQIVFALNDLDPSGSKASGFVVGNLPSFEAMGNISEEIVHAAYRIVGCSLSAEERAVGYLTEGRFLGAAFAYFSRCSTSGEAYRALEMVRAPAQLNGRQQEALRAFRARIEGHAPTPRPSSLK